VRTGLAGISLIKSFETCKLEAYPDPRGVWTVGWGHTGPEVVQGLVWTQDQADAQLAVDLHWAEAGVTRTVDIAITQNEFDALVSFTFNVGVGSEAHSTLVRYLNAHNIFMAADQFLVWDKVNGVENAGLLRRRQAERQLFLAQ
jgi:lysozyme